MDDNIVPDDQSQAFLQRAQSLSASILPLPALEGGRQRTFLFFLKTSHTRVSDPVAVYTCEHLSPTASVFLVILFETEPPVFVIFRDCQSFREGYLAAD